MADSVKGRTAGGTSRPLALVAFVAVSLATGWIGSIATGSALTSWYAGLVKPAFTPAEAILPVIWSVLYVMTGAGAWLVWLKPGSIARNSALAAFFVQLALTAIWAFAFFGARSTGLGLLAIAVLFAATAWMVLAANRVSRPAFLIFIPYLVWVAFVGVLNATIYSLN